MENDLISRSALLKDREYCDCPSCEDGGDCGFCYIPVEAVKNAPAVDAETLRPTGHWNIRSSRDILHRDVMFELFLIECSECKRKVLEGVDQEAARNGEYRKLVEQFPYCHCGCKMMEG